MKLSTKRIVFTTAEAKLVLFANSKGYDVALDY